MRRMRIFLVDDDASFHDFIALALEQQNVVLAGAVSGEEALGRIHDAAPDVILLDLMLPGMNGIETLRELRRRGVQTPVVLITSHAGLDPAVQALGDGAVDMLAKPVRVAALIDLLTRLRSAQLVPDAGAVDVPATNDDSEGALIGRSPQMLEVYKAIARVAQTDATVLIQGESGTGKELIARSIHRYSKRTGPFLAVNCAAIPDTLLESELFGHEKGAFTGATVSKAGKIERAHNGTFLLDEVGDMPLALQSKILRVLDERRIERIGGGRMIDVDVRIIAATHRELPTHVQRGDFREDLYFRLAVVTIHVPPLRQREGDIRLLIDHFVALIAPGAGRRITSIHPDVYAQLESYSWPGNVRELRNVLERSLVLGQGPVLLPDELPPLRSPVEHPSLFEQLASEQLSLEQVEKSYIARVLQVAGGNQCEAARRLGIHRNTLRRKMRE